MATATAKVTGIGPVRSGPMPQNIKSSSNGSG
jgi:hypothetical protein